MDHRLAWILFAALAMFGTGCGAWEPSNSDRLGVSGNIEMTQVDIAFKISGKLVELAVEEGMRVQEGMTVARLDAVQLQGQREHDLATVRAAESRLSQLKTSIRYQEEALESERAMREAEKKQAQAMLAQLLSGSRKQEIEQASAAVEEAGARQETARADWERARTLFENDDISASQRDQFKSAFETSSASLRRAQQQLALVIEGPRAEEIDAARAQLERVDASRRLTESTRLELQRKRQEIETRLAEIEQARARVRIVDAQLDDAVVASPISGVVLVKSAEVGEILAPGTTVVTVADVDRPWLRAYVGETDLGRVQLNSQVRVTTDSFPGKDYPGRVSFISSEAEFTPKQIQTLEERVKLVYRIKIEIDNPNQELKLNMPADAEIPLATEWDPPDE